MDRMPYLALDIGGTHIRIAAGSSIENLVLLADLPVSSDLTPNAVVDAIRNAAPPNFDAIGVSLAGVIDTTHSVVVRAMNLGWNDVRFGDALKAAFGVPVFLETDAFAAGIAESRHPQCTGVSPIVYVTIGTGIGHCVLIDGTPLRGADSGANVLGHLCIYPQGAPCYCGRRGCLCQYASGRGLRRLAAASGHDLPGAEIVLAAEHGEPWAQAVLTEAEVALTAALAAVATVVNPRLVILGGGVVGETWPNLPALTKRLQASVHPSVAGVSVLRGSYGGRAGLIGAAICAAESIEKGVHDR